jgi:hypothetical protein
VRALAERQARPELVKGSQPDIGWTPADRIEPGEYPAYSRFAKIYHDPQFKRWVCMVQFDVLNESLTHTLARLPWYLNLGDQEKPHAGRRTLFWEAWVTANGRQPLRSDRLSSAVFVKRYARVYVGDTVKDYRQKAVNVVSAYSVIRRVIEWQTRGSEITRL